MPTAPAFFFGVSTVLGLNEGRKARKSQARASRAQASMDRLRQQRQRQAQIREARVTRAQQVAQAEGQGATGSSASEGGLASTQSQLTSNLSFLDNAQQLGDFISSQSASAAKSAGRADVFSAAAGISSQYIKK